MVLFCLKQWENNQRWNEYTAGFFRGSALTQPEHTVELITENFTRRRGKEKKEEKKKKSQRQTCWHHHLALTQHRNPNKEISINNEM